MRFVVFGRDQMVGRRPEQIAESFTKFAPTRSNIQLRRRPADGTGRVVDLARNFRERFCICSGLRRHLGAPENTNASFDLADDVEALISVTRGEDVSKGGAVFLNERMELVDLREKSKPGEPTSPWYNAGLYAFRPSIFNFTAKLKPSPRGEFELTDAIRDLAQSSKKVKALELTGEWADVRDPEILARLNK